MQSLTQARLQYVIPIEGLDMGLGCHVSAESISGRHDGYPFSAVATLDYRSEFLEQRLGVPISPGACSRDLDISL